MHYVRGEALWIVVDRMTYERDKSGWSKNGAVLQSLWHGHPNTTMLSRCEEDAGQCETNVSHKSGSASLRMTMMSAEQSQRWDVEVVRGQRGVPNEVLQG